MEELESPPTAHTLRPHHISLLMVIMLLYRHYPRKRFHPSFLIQVHGVLLEEIVEVRLSRNRPQPDRTFFPVNPAKVVSQISRGSEGSPSQRRPGRDPLFRVPQTRSAYESPQLMLISATSDDSTWILCPSII